MKQLKLYLVTALLLMVAGQAWGFNYSITATTSDKNQGLVDASSNTSNPGYEETHTKSGSSTKAVSVYLMAQANEGYEFVGWSTTKGGTSYVSTENPYELSISKATTATYYAVFAAKAPGELSANEFYIKSGDKFVTTGSSSSLKLSDTPLAWTFAYSSSAFQIKNDKNYLTCTGSGTSRKLTYGTAASNLVLFDETGAQVTSLNSLKDGNNYYIVYKGSSYYLFNNNTFGVTTANVSGSKLTDLPSNPGDYQFTLTKSAVSGNYFGKVTATATTGGQVVIDANSTASSAFADESVKSWGAETNSEEKTWYFHAQANSGYEFMAWAEDAEGKKAVSTDADFSVKVTATSDNKSNPTAKQYYAIFRKTESGATINGYLKNMGNNKYLQMVKKATDTSSSNNNDGQLGFVESIDENTTSWSFTKYNDVLVKVADSNDDNIVYFGNQSNGTYRFKLCGIEKYNVQKNKEAPADNQSSAGAGSKYNCYLYKINNYLSTGTSFTATLVTTAEADGYYFIASANLQSSGTGLMLMGNTPATSSNQTMIEGTKISTSPGASSITVSVNDIKNYIYQIITPEPAPVEVTVSSAGYATYCSDKDLVVPANETVFGAKSKDDVVSLIPVEKDFVIKAGTGFIIKAEPGTVTFDISEDEGEVISDNELVGTTEYKQFNEGEIYLLGLNEGKVAFMLNKTGHLLAPNKAYLKVAKAQPQAKEILEIDEATGIESVNAVSSKSSKMFNLNGMRVNKNYKGLIIKNGKKFFLK